MLIWDVQANEFPNGTRSMRGEGFATFVSAWFTTKLHAENRMGPVIRQIRNIFGIAAMMVSKPKSIS
jgi:hypothetical protein